MANKSSDFNYKVALASGLKSLQSRRFRQAEEQFRYLMAHFPGAEGGYRGLAKVLVGQDDKPGALRVLLDGGAALAKANQRAGAIAIYREAVTLAPSDLTAHRRLAAALSLGGDSAGAAHEYVRYVKRALDDNQSERAQLEAAYALERMPRNHEIEEVARMSGLDVAAHANEPMHAIAEREELVNTTFGTAAPEVEPHEHEEPAIPMTPWQKGPVDEETEAAWSDEEAPIESAPEPEAPEEEMSDTWETPAVVEEAQPEPAAEPASVAEPAPTDWQAVAPAADTGEAGDGEMAAADEATVEESAATFLAAGDARGGVAALEAARRYIADGRMDAASDLLLQLISAGVADHDAQRLLIDVTKTMGKKEVAKAKVKLLVEALKLDGREQLAAEVEQLTEAI